MIFAPPDKEIACCSDSNRHNPSPVDEPASTEQENVCGDSAVGRRNCPQCGNPGHIVGRKTIFLMLQPAFFNQIGSGEYRFCARGDCPVIYFHSENPQTFTRDMLRDSCGVKESEGMVTVCYCFGFCEADIAREIAECGQSTIPRQVAALVKEGLCACLARNPSGDCCLKELYNAVKRIKAEL